MLTEENKRREREILREEKKKVKVTGDFHWRKVHQWTGEGDYIPGYDDGEEKVLVDNH